MIRPPRTPSLLAVASGALLVCLLLADRSRAAGTPAAGAPAAGPPAAGAPARPFVESVDVEVVNVDVVVTAGNGAAVDGLTAADFEIFEDGEQREVSNFLAFEDGRLVTDRIRVGQQEAAPLEAAQIRRMAILFDHNGLIRRDRDRAVEAIERFIEEQFDGTYEWSVVAYSDVLQLVQPFTRDKPTVLAALHQVKRLPVQSRRQTGSNSAFFSEEADLRQEGTIVRGVDEQKVGTVTLQDFEIRDRVLDSMQRVKRMAYAVIETMRAHANLSGRKSLVLVTGVLESLPTPAQLIGGAAPGAAQNSDRPDTMLLTLHNEVQQVLGGVVQVANASGFSIYPVSSLGFAASQAPYLEIERKSSPYSDSFGQMPTGEDTDTAPHLLADGTGGRYFATSKYYEAFDEVDSRTANAYVLGFRTTHAPDGKYHSIRVKVKRDGVRVEAREGFLHLTTEARLEHALATPLTFPKDRGDIPVRVQLAAEGGRGERERSLKVSGLMPVRELTLIPTGEQADGRVNLFLAIYDDSGKLVDLVKTHQDVRVPVAAIAAAAQDPSQNASFALKVKLKPGSYTVSLTMMDEVTTRYGTGLERIRL